MLSGQPVNGFFARLHFYRVAMVVSLMQPPKTVAERSDLRGVTITGSLLPSSFSAAWLNRDSNNPTTSLAGRSRNRIDDAQKSLRISAGRHQWSRKRIMLLPSGEKGYKSGSGSGRNHSLKFLLRADITHKAASSSWGLSWWVFFYSHIIALFTTVGIYVLHSGQLTTLLIF